MIKWLKGLFTNNSAEDTKKLTEKAKLRIKKKALYWAERYILTSIKDRARAGKTYVYIHWSLFSRYDLIRQDIIDKFEGLGYEVTSNPSTIEIHWSNK